TIGGLDAWVGHLVVAQSDGSRVAFAAAFIRHSADHLFRVLGHAAAVGDPNESLIFATARSFRILSDPARLEVRSDRVRVTKVASAGAFRSVVPKLGVQAIAIEPTSILNNRMPDEALSAGELVKIVVPG